MKRDFFPDPRPAKEQLRRTLRERLRAMNPDARAAASLEICRTAGQLPAFQEAACVALFAPLDSEPDIHPLIEEAWARRCRVVLPLMTRDAGQPRLEWHLVGDWDDVTVAGPFGLREPDPALCPRIDGAEVDCVFVPGLGFDGEGLRLGRGGGYYDEFLGRAPATLVRCGLMFACQGVAAIPREPHDQALPQVITERGLRVFGANR